MNERKYVFICGLHRSGTSVLSRNVTRFEDCTGFRNTGATEDEGQFLQDVYPVAARLGGPGRFGFNPQAHRTENSHLLTRENVRKLRESWHAHWSPEKKICVEKTPANILMTRFLQAAFPNSYFVIIRRHPVAVSIATQRFWKLNLVALHRLLGHWLHCHQLLDRDKPHLRHVYELTYENYVQDPARYHDEIAAFIGTRVGNGRVEGGYRHIAHPAGQRASQVSEMTLESLSGAHNEKYLKRWSKLLNRSLLKGYYRYISRKYEEACNQYGYSLLEFLDNDGEARQIVDRVLGPVYCLGADVYTCWWRLAARANWQLTSFSKAMFGRSARLRNKHGAGARMGA